MTEEDLYSACDAAFSSGWRRVKLYFLTGLPTETDEDTLGIAELARATSCRSGSGTPRAPPARHQSAASCRRRTRRSSGSARTACRSSSRKIGLLRDDHAPLPGVQLKWHDAEASFAEGLASRGDRRIGRVIERVWRSGGTFQEWSERFDLDRWTDAMAAEGLDADWYVTGTATRTRPCPGITSRRACTRTSSGRSGEPRSPSTVSPTAGGHPATTVACAPATLSSTSSRPRSRPRAGARAPARTSTAAGGARCALMGAGSAR